MTKDLRGKSDFDGVILPRLQSLGRKAPKKNGDLADPVVACYAAHLSKDWYGIYINALLATQNILGRPIFQSRKDDLHNTGEIWATTPLREKGRQAKAYAHLSDVLRASVAWLKERDGHLLTEIRKYVTLFDRISFRRPDLIEDVRPKGPGERNWTIYRWNAPFIAVAELCGPNSKGEEIAVSNFPPELLPLGAGKEPLIGLLKVPGGVFPRFQVWHRAEKHTGKFEDPWFAINLLGGMLDRSSTTRRRIQKFSPLRDQLLPEDAMDEWESHIAKKFQDLDIGLFLVEDDDVADKKDLPGALAHLSKWVTRRQPRT